MIGNQFGALSLLSGVPSNAIELRIRKAGEDANLCGKRQLALRPGLDVRGRVASNCWESIVKIS